MSKTGDVIRFYVEESGNCVIWTRCNFIAMLHHFVNCYYQTSPIKIFLYLFSSNCSWATCVGILAQLMLEEQWFFIRKFQCHVTWSSWTCNIAPAPDRKFQISFSAAVVAAPPFQPALKLAASIAFTWGVPRRTRFKKNVGNPGHHEEHSVNRVNMYKSP